MTSLWPQVFTDPTRLRPTSYAKNRTRVTEFFKANRPAMNMSEWIRHTSSVSRQRLHQVETHIAPVTQKTARLYADIYNDDPLRIQLRTGECPPDLAYLLGWELWDEFEEFLKERI